MANIVRVKIKSCCIGSWWYHKHIGEVIDVDLDRLAGIIHPGHVVPDTLHNKATIPYAAFNMQFIAEEDYGLLPSDNEDALAFLPRVEDLL